MHYLPQKPMNFFFFWKASSFTLLMASDTVLKVIVSMEMMILVQKTVGCKKRTQWMTLKMRMKGINFFHMKGQVNVKLCKHINLLNLLNLQLAFYLQIEISESFCQHVPLESVYYKA